ncbi:hypothetical protein ABK046_34980 [Streptomyces caeruleatus]
MPEIVLVCLVLVYLVFGLVALSRCSPEDLREILRILLRRRM